MLKTPIGRLRVVSLVEGISFLALLGIAMPLKYVAGDPFAVRWVGRVHGGLVILFCLALLHVMRAHDWRVKKALRPFLASLVPFGFLWIDRFLKVEEPVAGQETVTA